VEACRQAQACENILYTALIVLVVLILDELGEELSLWDYRSTSFAVPSDIGDRPGVPAVCLFHGLSMFRTWKGLRWHRLRWRYLLLCLRAHICFPGIYQTITWKYYYGLPIYFTMAILTKAAVGLLYRIAGRHKKGPVLLPCPERKTQIRDDESDVLYTDFADICDCVFFLVKVGKTERTIMPLSFITLSAILRIRSCSIKRCSGPIPTHHQRRLCHFCRCPKRYHAVF
jgi:hypothetical protein